MARDDNPDQPRDPDNGEFVSKGTSSSRLDEIEKSEEEREEKLRQKKERLDRMYSHKPTIELESQEYAIFMKDAWDALDEDDKKFGEIPDLRGWGYIYPENEEERKRVVEAYISGNPIPPREVPKGVMW